MKFRLLKSYLSRQFIIVTTRYRMAPDGLSFAVCRWLRQWPLRRLWRKRSYWAFCASIARS